MTKLTEAWQARAPRERLFLLGAFVFLGAVAFWLGVVEPLRSAAVRAERGLPELRRQAAEMRRLADEVGQLKTRAAQAVAAPAAADLIASASRHGFVATVVAAGEGGFDVRCDGAPVAGLTAWLAELAESHRLFVREARLDAAGDGRVSGEMVLGQ